MKMRKGLEGTGTKEREVEVQWRGIVEVALETVLQVVGEKRGRARRRKSRGGMVGGRNGRCWRGD